MKKLHVIIIEERRPTRTLTGREATDSDAGRFSVLLLLLLSCDVGGDGDDGEKCQCQEEMSLKKQERKQRKPFL